MAPPAGAAARERRLGPGGQLARVGALAAVAAFVALLPFVGSGADAFLWELAAIQVLYALAVNLLVGHAGIASFGQAALFGVGAYAVAMLSSGPLPAPLLLLIALLAAAGAAAIVGAFVSRIHGIAVAMFTLAVAQALYTYTFNSARLGGENGLPGIAPRPLLGLALTGQATFWFFCLAWVGLGVAALWLVHRSPLGLVAHAIRDDPKRATHLGLHVRRLRLLAFVISGAFCGLAGGLFAYANETVTPDQLNWTNSGAPVVMAAIGGMDSFWGPALGAVFYTWLVHQLSGVTQSWVLFVGLVFLGVVLLVPGGLISLPGRAAQVVARWRSR
jgi:branched-chain amino acid transport system permease protein